MARWADVADAERKARAATKAATDALADRELMMAWIRETGQADAYMEWYAKRLGIWTELYADNACG